MTSSDDEQRYRSGVVPLTIGVTGHRDLVHSELPLLRERVQTLFEYLTHRFPDRPLRILSPLAEGADRLVAKVALEMNLNVTVVLPMPASLYVDDFEDDSSRQEFEELCSRAVDVLELSVLRGASSTQVAERGPFRDRQYAQLGVFLCAHSHILLALWDGKPSEEIGGTAQVVRFHHHDVMAGYAEAEQINQQILADDDSDLVYHIVVSRQREGGAPREGLRALNSFWYTLDDTSMPLEELPEKYVDIFVRTAAFNSDAQRFAHQIATEAYPLIDRKAALALPRSVVRIDRFFRAADWLAIRYQRLYVRALKITHVFIFAMAVMLIFYSDVTASKILVGAFAVVMAAAYAVTSVASRGMWHQKYLEYRTLAEGLRVQFYWAAAGVTSDDVTKFSHENFLQKQDIELGWIRNVMRVAGIACDVAPSRDPEGLKFVLEEWIGDERRRGQLKYFRSKAAQNIARSQAIDDLGKVISVGVVLLLVGSVFAPNDTLRTACFVVLGIVLLIIGVREAYAFRVAEKEVIRQYEFMHRIFSNASKRLEIATDDAERRRILRVLGEAALNEHAEWILIHRERPLSGSQLWRVET